MGYLLGNMEFVASQAGPVEVKLVDIQQVISQGEVISVFYQIGKGVSSIGIPEEIGHVGDPVPVHHAFDGLSLDVLCIIAQILIGGVNSCCKTVFIMVSEFPLSPEIGHVKEVLH